MANKIRIDLKSLNIPWALNTSYKVDVEAGLVREVGGNKSYNPKLSSTGGGGLVLTGGTFTSFSTGPDLGSVFPSVGTTGSFVTTATLTFNRQIYLNTATYNLYLYKEIDGGSDELISTISNRNSRFNVISTNTVSLNLKDLIDSSSTYYLSSDEDIVVDMFRFPNDPIVESDFKYTTGRPNIDQVTPSYLATGSFTTTAVISFDRNIKKRSGNIYLYQQGGTLLETISTSSSRVTTSGDNVSVDLRNLLDTSSTYYLTSDYGSFDDIVANFRAEPFSEGKFKYTTGIESKITSTNPAFGTTNTFVTTATLTFDRAISTNTYGTKTLNLYKNGSLVRTFAQTSTNVTVNNSTASIRLFDQPMPEDIYHIQYDRAFFRDLNTFPTQNITDNTILKWTQTSISNMGLRRYRANVPYALFTTTSVPQIIDVDQNANKEYTLTLSAATGTFTSNSGINTGTLYIQTGTKASINSSITDINFNRVESNRNNNLTFSYSLTKDGVLLVDKTLDLIGIPFSLGVPLNLTISSPRVIDENITFTASVSTSTEMAGTVQFYSFENVIGTGTMNISGVASTVTAFASTGTKDILAVWLESTVVNGNRYETLNSAVQQIFVDLADRLAPGTLVLGSNTLTNIISSSTTYSINLNTSTQFTGTSSGYISIVSTLLTTTSTTILLPSPIPLIKPASDGGVYNSVFWLKDYGDGQAGYYGLLFLPENTTAFNSINTTTDIIEILFNGEPVSYDTYYKLSSEVSQPFNSPVSGVRALEVWRNGSQISPTSYQSGGQYADSVKNTVPIYWDWYRNIFSTGTVSLRVSTITSNQTVTRLTSTNVTTYLNTTSIFINNTSTYVSASGQLSTGTYTISAVWSGRWVAPKYYGTNSNNITQTILPKSNSTSSIRLSTSTFVYNVSNTSTTATIIVYGGTYQNHLPSGTVTLSDGATTLGSGSLSTPSSSISINTELTTSTRTSITFTANDTDMNIFATNEKLQLIVNGQIYRYQQPNTYIAWLGSTAARNRYKNEEQYCQITKISSNNYSLKILRNVDGFDYTTDYDYPALYSTNWSGEAGGSEQIEAGIPILYYENFQSSFWSTATVALTNGYKQLQIVWNPNTFGQVDQGIRTLTASYSGDDWNTSAISTATITINSI